MKPITVVQLPEICDGMQVQITAYGSDDHVHIVAPVIIVTKGQRLVITTESVTIQKIDERFVEPEGGYKFTTPTPEKLVWSAFACSKNNPKQEFEE